MCVSGVTEMGQLSPEALASEVAAFEENCKQIENVYRYNLKMFLFKMKTALPSYKKQYIGCHMVQQVKALVAT